jgi:hypothetical protein
MLSLVSLKVESAEFAMLQVSLRAPSLRRLSVCTVKA